MGLMVMTPKRRLRRSVFASLFKLGTLLLLSTAAHLEEDGAARARAPLPSGARRRGAEQRARLQRRHAAAP